jgi:hypothetical protein
MSSTSTLQVDVDQISEDFRTGKPHSLGCTVYYDGNTAAVSFLEVRDLYPPLHVDAFQAKLRQLAAALLAAAESPQVISVHLPEQPQRCNGQHLFSELFSLTGASMRYVLLFATLALFQIRDARAEQTLCAMTAQEAYKSPLCVRWLFTCETTLDPNPTGLAAMIPAAHRYRLLLNVTLHRAELECATFSYQEALAAVQVLLLIDEPMQVGASRGPMTTPPPSKR